MARSLTSRKSASAFSGLLGSVMDASLAKRGFANPSLLLRWEEIMGQDLARLTKPMRITRQRDGAVLHIQADEAVALELQHLAPQILSKIARVCGAGAVAQLRVHKQYVAPATKD